MAVSDAYPPYYYYPPGYPAGSVFVRVHGGDHHRRRLWGGCNWGGGNVNINVNNYNNFNTTNINNPNWQHNPEHRKGVEYRDQGSRRQYGGQRPGADSREAYRGRAENGRQDIARGGPREVRRRPARGADRAGGRERRRGRRGSATPAAASRVHSMARAAAARRATTATAAPRAAHRAGGHAAGGRRRAEVRLAAGADTEIEMRSSTGLVPIVPARVGACPCGASLSGAACRRFAADGQKTFASPEEAAQALVPR